MREPLQFGWAARRWRCLVGVRWERFVLSVRWRVVGAPREAVRFWRAAGCPAQFRPRAAFRRLALVRALRFGLFVALVVFGPWLLALLFR